MDANRFDTLSRQLGTTQPRRGVLRLVGALPLLGALASLRGEPAGAETPLERVQDRAEQRQERKDRPDRHEQRKGKRKGDGDGDGKNDGGGDGVNLGAPAPGSGECPPRDPHEGIVPCKWTDYPEGSHCPNDLLLGFPDDPGQARFCACQPFESIPEHYVCMVAPPTLDRPCRTTESCPPGYVCSRPWAGGPGGVEDVCVALCPGPSV